METKNKKRPSGSKRVNNTRNQSRFLNTDLCVDLKTYLRNDRIAMIGKNYLGVLRHDQECHYTFVETLNADKRNPQVFNGRYITVTRRDDGTLRPNFKPLKMEKDFSVNSYATGVANELLWALSSLLEK